MEEIKIQGGKYSGHFKAEPKTQEYHVKGDTGYRNRHWFEGQGKITKRKDNKEIKFLFKTSERRHSLEDSLILFNSRSVSMVPKPKIKNYERIVDILLENIYKRFKAQIKGGEIVPNILIPSLNICQCKKLNLIESPYN